MQSRNVIDIAVYRSKMKTMDEAYACPIGVCLWEEHRKQHPEAPTVPPVAAEDWPLATEYWDHANGCDDCNEV
jgi:hypothetical protein